MLKSGLFNGLVLGLFLGTSTYSVHAGAQDERAVPGGTRPAQIAAASDAPAPHALAVVELINQIRDEVGAPRLRWDPACAKAATDHAIDTGRNRLRGHTGSDGSQLQDRYRRYSQRFSLLAENWAYLRDPSGNLLTPRNIVKAWSESPGHWANIVDPELTHSGVGLYRQGNELIAVQCFSTLR